MAQRLNNGVFVFGNGIEFDQDSQTISIDIAANKGLEFISGELAVNVDENAGLELSSTGVGINLFGFGALEFNGSGELKLAGTVSIIHATNGSSTVFVFGGDLVEYGVQCGNAFAGNDNSTATTAIFSQINHRGTPAISQTSSGDTRIVSASGQVIRIIPGGTAGTWIGAGSKDLTPTGLGSIIVGGTDTTGNITATGQNNAAVGVALTSATIQSTGSFFSFAVGCAFSSANIQASSFASLAYGFASGSGSAITCSGIGACAGGMAGLGLPATLNVTGSAAFAWGAGHSVTGATAAAFGRSNTISVQSGAAFGEDHTVSAVRAFASGRESNARLVSCRSLAGDSFSADGDGQQIDVTAYARTTDATPATMTIDGGSTRLTIQAESTVSFSILVTAKEEAAGGERAAYRIEGCIYRDATAASTTVAGVTTTVLHESTGTMDATVTADTTNGAMNIVVTGVAASNIRWVAAVRMAEVVGSA